MSFTVSQNVNIMIYTDLKCVEAGKFCIVGNKVYTACGYCYLLLFDSLDPSIKQLMYIANKFGKFPKLNKVIKFMDAYIPDNTKVLKPRISAQNLLHVENYHNRIDFYTFKEMYKHLNYSIGGDFSIPHSAIPSICQRAGLDYHAEVSKVIARDLAQGESAFAEMVRNSIINDAKRLVDPSYKSDKLIIRHKLTAEEESQLTATFPELALDFRHDLFHPHAFAAASRVIEEQINIMSLGVRNSAKIPEGFDVLVKDSGGDPFKQVKRGRYNYHCCCPILSIYDQQRDASRMASMATLNNLTNLQKKALRKYNDDVLNGTNFFSCNDVSEQCSIRAPFMTFLHSTYDRTTTDIANAMSVASASVATGSFIFDPGMLVQSEGEIKLLSAYYSISLKDKVKYITMGFKADTSWCYTHRLDTYISLLVNPVITDSVGQAYFVNILSIRNSVVFFKIIKCGSKGVLPGIINHRIWLNNEDLMTVQCYDWWAEGYDTQENHMRLVRFVAPRKLVSDGMGYAYGLDHNKFSVASIFLALRSFSTRVVGTKAVCQAAYDMPQKRLLQLASAIFLKCFVDRFGITKATSEVTNEILELRNQKGISFTRMFRNLWRKFSEVSPPKNIESDRIVFKEPIINPGNIAVEGVGTINFGQNFFEKCCKKLIEWSATPKKYSVHIEDAVSFIDIQTVIETDYSDLDTKVVNYLPKLEFYDHDDPLRDGPLSDEACNIESENTHDSDDDNDKTLSSDFDSVTVVQESGRPNILAIEDFEKDSKILNLNNSNISIHMDEDRDIYQPLADLVKGEAVGDGNCLFDSIRQVTGYPFDIESLKRDLLRSSAITEIPSSVLPDVILTLTSRNAWGGETEIILASKTLNVNFVLYSDVLEFKPRVYEANDNKIFAYLLLENRHYSPLFYKSFRNISHNDTDLIDLDNRTHNFEINNKFDEVEIAEVVRNVVNDLVDECDINVYNNSKEFTDNFVSIIDSHNIAKDSIFVDTSIEKDLIEIEVGKLCRVGDFMSVAVYEKAEEVKADFDVSVNLGTSIKDVSVVDSAYEIDENCQDGDANKLIIDFITAYDEQMKKLNLSDIDEDNITKTNKFKNFKNFKVLTDFINLDVNVWKILNTIERKLSIMTIINKFKNYNELVEEEETFYTSSYENWEPIGASTTIGDNNEHKDVESSIKVKNFKSDDFQDANCISHEHIKSTISISFMSLGGVDFNRAVKRLIGVKKSHVVKTIAPLETDTKTVIDKMFKRPLNHVDITKLTSKGEKPVFVNVEKKKIKKKIRPFELLKSKSIDKDKSITNEDKQNENVLDLKSVDDFVACLRNKSVLLGDTTKFIIEKVENCDTKLSMLICSVKQFGFLNKNFYLDMTNLSDDVMNYLIMIMKKVHDKKKTLIVDLTSLDSQDMIDSRCEMLKNFISDGFTGAVLVYTKLNSKILEIGYNETKASDKDNKFWKSVCDPKFPIPEHKPKFRKEKTANDSAVNAITEIRELWKTSIGIANRTYDDVYIRLSNPLSSEVKRFMMTHKEKFSVYDRFESKWLIRQDSDGIYDQCYDGECFTAFEPLVSQHCLAGDKNRLLLCGKSTVLLQEPNLLRSTDDHIELIKGFSIPVIDMVVGVPGCGKTTFILNNHKEGSLVLTSSSEGACDIRERMAKKFNRDPIDYKENYRTIDSYLLNSKKEYDTVWIDEALMRHPGEIFMICLYTKCMTLHLLGDPNQIGYINRVGTVSVQYGNFKKFFKPSRVLNISYRCPVDIMAMLYPKYEGGTRSASSVIKSVAVKTYTSLANVPLDNDTYKYLVFKQSDKDVLKRAGYNVSTIHEFQGKQHKNIIIVRLSTKVKEEIYNSKPHILVAISRHTNSLTYYTPVRDDLRYLLERNIDSKLLNKVKFDLSGGALDIISSRPVESSDCDYVNNMITKTVDNDHVMLNFETSELEFKPLYSQKVQNLYGGDINTLIYYHDLILPGNAYHHHYYDSINLLNNEIDVELDDITIVEAKRHPRIRGFDKLRPVLPTMMPSSRRPSQLESIIALNKRNMAVPELDGLVDPNALAERLLTQFVDAYIAKDKLWALNEYKNFPIKPNSELIENWLTTQDPSVRKMLNPPDRDLSDWDWNKYKFMIKPTVKPTLDLTAPYINNALQTIACQEKYHNAIFCPIFKEVDRRLEAIYNENFRVFTRITNENFSKKMEEIIPPELFEELLSRGAQMLEIDISKYDKSQGLAALMFDCLIMEIAGVEKFYIDLWFHSHIYTYLKDIENGVRYRVAYQRKSGDASTFCENTRFLMAVIATMFDMKRVYFAMFAGDDSWLLTDGEFKDMNSWCATLLNLESKFFKYHRSIYFCSKYFVHDGISWYVVPDPVKLLVKLGRSDLANYTHVEEYRTSLVDLTGVFDNINIVKMLSIAIAERYGVSFNVDILMGTLRTFINNPQLFKTLYYSNPDDVLCDDPTTSKL